MSPVAKHSSPQSAGLSYLDAGAGGGGAVAHPSVHMGSFHARSSQLSKVLLDAGETSIHQNTCCDAHVSVDMSTSQGIGTQDAVDAFQTWPEDQQQSGDVRALSVQHPRQGNDNSSLLPCKGSVPGQAGSTVELELGTLS